MVRIRITCSVWLYTRICTAFDCHCHTASDAKLLNSTDAHFHVNRKSFERKNGQSMCNVNFNGEFQDRIHCQRGGEFAELWRHIVFIYVCTFQCVPYNGCGLTTI